MKTILIPILIAISVIGGSFAELSPAPEARVQQEAADKPHWLTNSSGVRHNRSCRWYGRAKGRPSTRHEGRACKICGG